MIAYLYVYKGLGLKERSLFLLRIKYLQKLPRLSAPHLWSATTPGSMLTMCLLCAGLCIGTFLSHLLTELTLPMDIKDLFFSSVLFLLKIFLPLLKWQVITTMNDSFRTCHKNFSSTVLYNFRSMWGQERPSHSRELGRTQTESIMWQLAWHHANALFSFLWVSEKKRD